MKEEVQRQGGAHSRVLRLLLFGMTGSICLETSRTWNKAVLACFRAGQHLSLCQRRLGRTQRQDSKWWGGRVARGEVWAVQPATPSTAPKTSRPPWRGRLGKARTQHAARPAGLHWTASRPPCSFTASGWVRRRNLNAVAGPAVRLMHVNTVSSSLAWELDRLVRSFTRAGLNAWDARNKLCVWATTEAIAATAAGDAKPLFWVTESMSPPGIESTWVLQELEASWKKIGLSIQTLLQYW